MTRQNHWVFPADAPTPPPPPSVTRPKVRAERADARTGNRATDVLRAARPIRVYVGSALFLISCAEARALAREFVALADELEVPHVPD